MSIPYRKIEDPTSSFLLKVANRILDELLGAVIFGKDSVVAVEGIPAKHLGACYHCPGGPVSGLYTPSHVTVDNQARYLCAVPLQVNSRALTAVKVALLEHPTAE
jgi:hypothetical protein